MRVAEHRRAVARPDVCVFHAVMEGSSVPLGGLQARDGPAFVERFRGSLYRAAREQLGGMPEGILMGAVHGAYDANTETFPLHIHGVVTDGKVALIDALRTLDMYRPAEAGDGRDAARTPIVMSRKPLTNMPDPISYILKSYWPMRPTEMGPDGLRRAIATRVTHIPEPAQSEYLRWLDRWTINQLTLILGMHASDTGLRSH